LVNASSLMRYTCTELTSSYIPHFIAQYLYRTIRPQIVLALKTNGPNVVGSIVIIFVNYLKIIRKLFKNYSDLRAERTKQRIKQKFAIKRLIRELYAFYEYNTFYSDFFSENQNFIG
jgi:hypothetical protein